MKKSLWIIALFVISTYLVLSFFIKDIDLIKKWWIKIPLLLDFLDFLVLLLFPKFFFGEYDKNTNKYYYENNDNYYYFN